MPNFQTFYHSDYSGGLRDTASPIEINDNEASLLRNWDFTYQGQLIRRLGLTKVGNTIHASNPITGLGAYIRDNGQDALAIETTNLYYLNSTTWTKIADSTKLTAPPAGGYWGFENIQVTGKIYFGHEDQLICSWDRAGTTLNSCITVQGSTTPHGNVYRWHKNHFFTMNNVNVSGTKFKHRLYWTSIGDPTAWDTTNNFFEIPGDGRAITMIDLGNTLVLFKERAIQYLTGWGNASWSVSEASSNVSNVDEQVGIAGLHAACRVGNDVWFVDQEGNIRRLYLTDQDAFRKDIISTKIQGTLAGINKSQLGKAVAWSNNQKVYFAFPNGSDTTNSLICVFDIIAAKRTGEEAWTTYTGWTPNLMMDYPTSTTPDLYIGNATSGKVYKVAGSDDDGTAIDARWDSSQNYYGNVPMWKRYAKGKIRGVAGSGSINVDLYASIDSSGFGKVGTINLQGSGGTLGPTGTFRLGPTGTSAVLGGNSQVEKEYFVTDGGLTPRGRSLMMSIRHNTANQRPTINTFYNLYKNRVIR